MAVGDGGGAIPYEPLVDDTGRADAGRDACGDGLRCGDLGRGRKPVGERAHQAVSAATGGTVATACFGGDFGRCGGGGASLTTMDATGAGAIWRRGERTEAEVARGGGIGGGGGAALGKLLETSSVVPAFK